MSTIRGPIFLISPDGMLGRAFVEELTRRGLPFTSKSYPEIDITKPDALADAVPSDAQIVINCSAYTDVDGAEKNEEAANLVNGEGVGNLARLCASRGATLVHFSTDYVFNGEATKPYRTDGEHDPVNAYGRSKAIGERLLRQSGCEHLLLRTSWLYAPWANNFVRTMAKLTRDRDKLTVVNDQRGRPSSASYVVERTLGLLASPERGTFHVTDGGECTWYEFTREIARQLGNTCDVQPCTSDAFPRPAKRPAYSVMSLQRTEDVLGPSAPWQQNLATVLKTLEPLD